MSLRDQFEDWKYLVSRDNRTSRGFYIIASIFVFAIIILCLLAFIAAIIGKTAGILRIIGFVAFPVSIIGTAILIRVLSR